MRVWQRFVASHLFDYNPPATRLWLAIVASGAVSALWALAELARLAPDQWLPVVAGVVMVMVAGLFPIRIPRSSFSLGIADVFIFSLLITLGTAPAVIAAGAEGALGSWRSSKRLTSRLSTPAANMAAMAACGTAFSLLRDGLTTWLHPEAADLVALCSVAGLQFLLATFPLTAVILIKRGLKIDLRDWFGTYSWLGALSLASALVAGIVHLNAVHFGRTVLVAGGLAVIAVAMLVRVSFQRQEAEHAEQEARINEAQRQAQISQMRFASAFTHAGVGMAIVDQAGAMLQVNQALCSLLGRQEAELVGRTFSSYLQPGDVDLFERSTGAGQPDAAGFSMELRCLGPGEHPLWVALHCSRFDDTAGAGTCRILQLHDISSRRQAESRLQHIAYHDSLTDLANRSCFQERLGVAVERSRLDDGTRFAVLFLDLDRFKVVNDSLGHLAGNELLREVAGRLRSCVRRPSDLVARLGGDEFAILLDGLHATEDGLRLADRLLAALMRPVALCGTEVVPGASIGITFSDLGYRTVDEVLRDADLAMYAAKAAGRGRVVLFDQSMHEHIADKLALEADLRRAIGGGQLSLAFQPIFDLEPYRLIGFEALARWVHPERGPISPAVFVTLAEESGHIEALTRWVIDQAARQLADWQASHREARGLGVHVNISGRDLAQPGLVAHVRKVLRRYRLDPSLLTLEITETTLMGQLEVSLQALKRLRAVGVHFSIDDFGTGYSSLAYLSSLPIDSLKIDRSFVMGMSTQGGNVEIVRAVNTLGRSLGKRVIAEGIETPDQLETLRELGVACGQGYLLSRPLPAEQVPGLLERLATA